MKVYAQIEQNKNVLNIGTVQEGVLSTEVILTDPVMDLTKLPGYHLSFEEDAIYMSFDQVKYNRYVEEQMKNETYEKGKELLEHLSETSVLESASREDAYIMRYLYEEWEPNTDYKTGNRRRHGDTLYECRQDHTSEAQHTPGLIPALWDIVAPDAEQGTIDNPIKVPETVSSMKYVKGKYYLEDGKLYLMSRDGMKDGEAVSLNHKPSQLTPHYFTLIENN